METAVRVAIRGTERALAVNMARRRTFRLADAFLLLLIGLLPLMLLLTVSGARNPQPTLLFWMLVLLPLLMLPWLLLCCDPEESEDAPRAVAKALGHQEGQLQRFAEAVTPLIPPRREFVDQGLPVIEGIPRVPPGELYNNLQRRLAPSGVTPLVESLGDHSVRVIGLPSAVTERLRSRSAVWLHVVLFAATLVTTVYAGALHQGVNLLEQPGRFGAGLPYALALLAILGIHELGHYVAARRNGVHVTPPYFIPAPMGLGTFGAFIQIKALIQSRRAVFDIGVAGPLAGLVVALPLLYLGLENAPVSPRPGQTGIDTGSSMLLAIVYQLAHGGDLGAAAITLTPIAFAGWIGLVVTALNLVPVGQLDGGHIAYALFGRRRARTVSIAATLLMVALGLFAWPGLLTWALLIALLAGFSHMPALDDVTPPDAGRFALGAVTFALLLLIVLPVPGAGGGTGFDTMHR